MSGDHFTLDVDPEAVRRVVRRLRTVAGDLEGRGGKATATPGEIGASWTGRAATRVKGEMRGLGGALTGHAGLHSDAAEALAALARHYQDALDRLPGLNSRWDDAQSDHAAALREIDQERTRAERDLAGQPTNNRMRHEEIAETAGNRRTAAGAALDRRSAAITADYDDLCQGLREHTRTAARALSAAQAIRRPPRHTKHDVDVIAGPVSWSVQARSTLHDVMPMTGLHYDADALVDQPPDAWRSYAQEFGLPVPDTLDLARGLELAHELDQVLADNAHLDARGRSDAVRQWVEGLDPLDLTTLAMVDPARVGNLDGIPNDVRYASNQVNLTRAVESERQRVADWLPPPDKDDSDWAAYQRLSRRTEVMEQLLLDRPYDGSTPVSGLGRAHYQVLSFEPPTYSGDDVVDDGRLAVVVGDLDTARDVGVVVPGITNRIDNFNATLEKADNVQALVPDSATIAWLGYDTPEFEDSVTTGDAERGARALQDFIEGMRRAEQSEVAVLAHSYGTLVTGTALRNGMRPDRVVLFGSPGLGQDITSTADLGLPDGYPIFALRAPGDFVSLTAAHGTDPADMPGVTRLDAGDVSGHSQYTRENSESLYNLAAVLAGDVDAMGNLEGVTTTSTTLDQEGLLGPYNQNLRSLVDELQAEVPPEVLARFIHGLEQDVQNHGEGGTLDWRNLPGKLRDAAETSRIGDHLSDDELGQALREAGFTDTTGDLAGDTVEGALDAADVLDDLPIPITLPGAPPIVVTPPDGVNEALGDLFGHLTDETVTGFGDELTEHIPSLETVLDIAEVGVDTADTAIGAYHAFREGLRVTRELPGLVRDATGRAVQEGWDRTRDFGEGVVERGSEAVDDAEDFVRDLVPGI